MKSSSIVVLAERRVRAVLPVEDQRKPLAVADPEENERRQALRHHSARLDALARELLKNEAAHVLVSDAGDQTALQSQPGRAAGDVRRRASDVLVEGAMSSSRPPTCDP